MLTEISQTKKDKYYVISHCRILKSNIEFIETESRLVVTWAWKWWKWGDVGQRVQGQ